MGKASERTIHGDKKDIPDLSPASPKEGNRLPQPREELLKSLAKKISLLEPDDEDEIILKNMFPNMDLSEEENSKASITLEAINVYVRGHQPSANSLLRDRSADLITELLQRFLKEVERQLEFYKLLAKCEDEYAQYEARSYLNELAEEAKVAEDHTTLQELEATFGYRPENYEQLDKKREREYRRWEKRHKQWRERLRRKIRSASRTRDSQICEVCKKRLPDEKTFKSFCIDVWKEGFFLLDPRKTRTKPYCLCEDAFWSRLGSLRTRRSRIARAMVFLLIRRQKDKLYFVKRKPATKAQKKALQRHLKFEDEVLWIWDVYDSNGNPHNLEEILDTPLIKDMLNLGQCKGSHLLSQKRQSELKDILSRIVHDPSLVLTALLSEEPQEPLEPSWIDPHLEALWRERLDGAE